MDIEKMKLDALKHLLDYPDGLYNAKWPVNGAVKTRLIKEKLVELRGPSHVPSLQEVVLTKRGRLMASK